MECFLAEYGMIWVGEDSDDTGLDALSIDKEVCSFLFIITSFSHSSLLLLQYTK